MNEIKIDRYICSTTTQTITELLKYKNGSDAIALYMFYIATAKRQETNQPFALPSFCKIGLHWGDYKFKNADKVLRECGLVKKIKDIDTKGVIRKWYVKINFILKQETLDKVEHTTTNSGEQKTPQEVDNPDGRLSTRVDLENKCLKNITKCLKNIKKKNSDIYFNRDTNEFIGIKEQDIKDWIELYPQKDIKYELGRMRQWLITHYKRVGTRDFINNWLDREKLKQTYKQGQQKEVDPERKKQYDAITTIATKS